MKSIYLHPKIIDHIGIIVGLILCVYYIQLPADLPEPIGSIHVEKEMQEDQTFTIEVTNGFNGHRTTSIIKGKLGDPANNFKLIKGPNIIKYLRGTAPDFIFHKQDYLCDENI